MLTWLLLKDCLILIIGQLMKLCILQAKELEVNTQYYIDLLAKGIGKTQEETAKDIQKIKILFPIGSN